MDIFQWHILCFNITDKSPTHEKSKRKGGEQKVARMLVLNSGRRHPQKEI